MLSSTTMSMISNALITGGTFYQNINDQRQIYVTQTHKSALDRLKEAVADAAMHNSGERFDPPKCHPNTRVAVRDKIEKWALRTDPDTIHASILWLSGAAGAGKSAIAQTVAEDFHSRGLLIASFFFGRSDPTRNHARSLVATIVYQLYTLLPPPEQGRVLAVIERDPLIFTKSLLVQFEALIVNPLQPLWKFWSSSTPPGLIIIDGLDECLDRGMQREVLRVLSASVQQFHLPFVFLLASRPEHDIQAVFGSPDFLPIHTRLFLDDTYLPDRDIELFLRDQFLECRTTHPFRHMIPHNWPSEEIVNKITRKSSGQFIYASVVAKYIKSSRHRPHHQLDVILNLRPASSDLPFSELDTLYTYIFSSVDNVERVLDIVSFLIIIHVGVFADDIEHIHRLGSGEVVVSLCDLSSVIGFQADENGRLQLNLLHASLADYLLDSARSKDYFIDVAKHGARITTACFQFLSDLQYEHTLDFTIFIAMSCFDEIYVSLKLTEPLYHAIKGFSISRIYNLQILIDNGRATSVAIAQRFAFGFLPALFRFLQKSDSAKHLELYQHHRSEYDLFLRQSLTASASRTPIPLFFALVAIHHKLPQATFHPQLCLFGVHHFDDRDLAIFQLNQVKMFDERSFLEYLFNFLWDPKRSQGFCAGPKLFALAAKHCLLYLCNHTAFAQKALPRMSTVQYMRRKNTPWKWHQRVLREDIKGPHDAPWLWLQRTSAVSVPTCVFHRKTNDLIYAYWHSWDLYTLQHPSTVTKSYNPRVVKHRFNSEKYHLALKYLNYFLPRAAKVDELVHMCQTLTLASRSQDFPQKSARAQSNMYEYATRWG